ncbi:FAD-dependent oxidoreductase [Robbsia sp. KACC 23696]|uniref:NAD(P)/FAD-dependent oxidoreductase n=1 Tax=Robbsia sp. KACC 23696 TaxID=3149231 RepID=UPI00325B6B59
MKQFDLIVIGAGISGMAVAMRAIEAGMHVALVDDHATVGEGASFFHSGVMLPPPLDPWFGPDAALPTPGGVPWRRSARERAADAQRHARLAPLQPLIAQSASRLEALARRYEIDFERRDGALYAWRNATAFQRVKALIAEWPGASAATAACAAPDPAAERDVPPATSDGTADDTPTTASTPTTPPTPEATSAAARIDLYGHTARILDAEACRAMEPALEHAEALAGGVAFDGLSSGNAAVMAKRLKQCLDAADVRFLLAREAIRIDVHGNGVDVSIRPAQQAVGAFSGVQARGFMAPSTAPILGLDARQTDPAQHVEKICGTNVVIAAGAGSAKLLGDMGIALPLQRVTRTTLTGTVLREDYAPRHLLVDAENGAAIVRFDRRVRVSSCLYGQAATIGKVSRKGASLPPGPPAKALQALPAQLHRWRDSLVPGAARFDGPPGESVALVGADGLPVIGTLRGRQTGGRLHLVLSGAHRGWGLAFGAADLLFAQWGHTVKSDGDENAHGTTESTTDVPAPVPVRDARDTFDSAARMALSPARFGH